MAQAGAHGNFMTSAIRWMSGAKDEEAVFMPMLQGLTPLGDVETTLQPLQRAYDVMQQSGGPSVSGAWAGARAGALAGVNMTTPAIRAPFEMGLGRSTYSGGEIKNWNDWLAGQAFGGPGRQVSRAVGIADQPIVPGLTSYATGIQLQANTKKRQKGEFQRRKDLLDKQIESLKNAKLAKSGGSKQTVSERRWKRTSTPEVRQLQKYLKYGGQSLGY
jgi:hypothetical protein